MDKKEFEKIDTEMSFEEYVEYVYKEHLSANFEVQELNIIQLEPEFIEHNNIKLPKKLAISVVMEYKEKE